MHFALLASESRQLAAQGNLLLTWKLSYQATRQLAAQGNLLLKATCCSRQLAAQGNLLLKATCCSRQLAAHFKSSGSPKTWAAWMKAKEGAVAYLGSMVTLIGSY